MSRGGCPAALQPSLLGASLSFLYRGVRVTVAPGEPGPAWGRQREAALELLPRATALRQVNRRRVPSLAGVVSVVTPAELRTDWGGGV